MVDYWTNNLNSLRASQPDVSHIVAEAVVPDDWQILSSRSGWPTLVVDSLSVHSRIDPWLEARVWASSHAVRQILNAEKKPTLFGFGLGYQVLALLEVIPKLVIIEPQPAMIKLALTHLDFSMVMDRIHLVLEKKIHPGLVSSQLLIHRPSKRLNPDVGLLPTGRMAASFMDVSEKVAHLSTTWNNIPGTAEVIGKFDRDSMTSGRELVEAVLDQRGPMSEGEIYILLAAELTDV